jgi:hypothetical protein
MARSSNRNTQCPAIRTPIDSFRQCLAAFQSPRPASNRKPTGVTNTVQTRVLNQGSDWFGVLKTVPRNWTLMGIVLPRPRLESRNRTTPPTGSFHQGGMRAKSTAAAMIKPTASVFAPCRLW